MTRKTLYGIATAFKVQRLVFRLKKLTAAVHSYMLLHVLVTLIGACTKKDIYIL